MKKQYDYKFFNITKLEAPKIVSVKINGTGHITIETLNNLDLSNIKHTIKYSLIVNDNPEIVSEKNRIFIAKYLNEGTNNIIVKTILQVENNEGKFVEFTYKKGTEIYV